MLIPPLFVLLSAWEGFPALKAGQILLSSIVVAYPRRIRNREDFARLYVPNHVARDEVFKELLSTLSLCARRSREIPT